MKLEINFHRIVQLVKHLGRHMTFFDLETTTFRGQDEFGITEVCCFTVAPDGTGVIHTQLINPERKISAKAREITGITQHMVKDQETWGKRYAGLFAELATSKWVAGYNVKSFDCPAVKDMNARYGKPIEEFKFVLDVLVLHRNLSAPSGKRESSLANVAAYYGLKPAAGLHRAMADVVLTVEVFNTMLDAYGMDAILARILPKPEGAYDKLTAQTIARYVKGKTPGSVTLADVAKAFKVEERKVNFELGRAIDELLVDPQVFADADTQAWLLDALMEVSTDALNEGKLKPIYDALVPMKPEGVPFDYVQLRVGLNEAGFKWSTRKPD